MLDIGIYKIRGMRPADKVGDRMITDGLGLEGEYCG